MAEQDTLPGPAETPDAGNEPGDNNSSQNAADNTSDNNQQDKPKPKAPEKYEFKVPDGTNLNKDMLSDFEKLARASDMTNEDAQKYVDLQLKNMASWSESMEAAQKKQVDDWKEALDKDEILKEPANRAIAQRALEGYSEKLPEDIRAEFKGLMETGLLYHPGFLRFMYAVGKDIADDKFRDGDSSGGGDSYQKQLNSMYPTSVKKTG